MGWLSLLALSVALAMDAFAVAMVAGLTVRQPTGHHFFRLSFHFGLFQGLMLAIGWLVGKIVHSYVASSDHWIAFAILAFIGGRTIWHAAKTDGDQAVRPDPTAGWDLVLLSLATSIDALAVGLSLAMTASPIITPALVVAVTACSLTLVGMIVGRRVGALWGRTVEILGGVVLISIGINIVWKHMAA